MTYFWQTDDWPNFTYELDASCQKDLYAFSEQTGRVGGLFEGLDDEDQTEARIRLMVSEAMKTSEIEGEYLRREDVISSVRRNLGLTNVPIPVHDLSRRGCSRAHTGCA